MVCIDTLNISDRAATWTLPRVRSMDVISAPTLRRIARYLTASVRHKTASPMTVPQAARRGFRYRFQ